MKKTRIGVIVGPTACGKTASSIAVAKKMDAEIISADSIQVYRGLDIGSAKPTREEMQGIAHHMIDVVDASDAAFSVGKYLEGASACIDDIAARGKFPLVVGGTGLYIHALTSRLNFTQVSADEELRAALNQKEREDPGSLYRELQVVDPESADRLHPNDIKRIVRALEVYRISGRTITSFGNDFVSQQQQEGPYDAVMIGLTMDRQLLYQRIEQRVDLMMQAGLLEETERLYRAGYDPAVPALQGLGYKQLLKYLQGEYTLDEAVQAIKTETRHFAKRQFTWFKRDQRIQWLDVTEFEDLNALCDEMIAILSRKD